MKKSVINIQVNQCLKDLIFNMNYYDETLEKIEKLLNENKEDEALLIINDELRQAYVPKDFEEKLIKYKNSFQKELVKKSLSDDEIIEYLKGPKEKQLIAVSLLDKKNLRDYVDVCNAYLSGDGFINAKVLLIDSLIRQEIGDDITFNNNGLEFNFIPKYQLPIEESDGYSSGNKYLEDYYMKDPSKLKMAKSLLYKELMLNLPINLEESEGVIIAKDICEYIEEAFNKDICTKKENLN